MNRTIARILILFFFMLRFTFVPLCIYAQSILKPGDKTINYALIKSCSNSYKLTVYDSLGKAIQDIISIDMITVDTVKGLLTRAQHGYFSRGFMKFDSTFADLKTLAPKHMRAVSTPSFIQMDLQFSPTAVHAVVNKNNILTDTIHTMEAGYFDSNLFSYLLGFLPYKEGFSALINIYTFEKKGGDLHKVEYMGEDVLPGTTHSAHLIKIIRVEDKRTEFAWYDSLNGALLRLVMPFGKGLVVIAKI
jgi:hypothetical protein